MSQDQKIDHLQDRIEALEKEQAKLREALAAAQLEQWEGRLDDLEVQLHLGGMELSDRIGPLVGRVRAQLSDARGRLEDGAETASEVASTIRTGVEQAWDDLRSAVSQASSVARG